MRTIDVDGVPEPIVRSFEAIVETVRHEFKQAEKPRGRVELPRWPGKVLGALTREAIYEDVGRARTD